MLAPPTNLQPKSGIQGQADQIAYVVGLIFSWVILLPACVIISGKFLASVFSMPTNSNDVFKIPLWILNLEARRDEVTLGLTGFIITLAIVAFWGGKSLYLYSRDHLGIDPGQFHTLCFTSAVATVIWSAFLWVVTRDRRRSKVTETEALMVEIGSKVGVPINGEKKPPASSGAGKLTRGASGK